MAAFTGEDKEVRRYEEKQDQALITAVKAGIGYVMEHDPQKWARVCSGKIRERTR